MEEHCLWSLTTDLTELVAYCTSHGFQLGKDHHPMEISEPSYLARTAPSGVSFVPSSLWIPQNWKGLIFVRELLGSLPDLLLAIAR